MAKASVQRMSIPRVGVSTIERTAASPVDVRRGRSGSYREPYWKFTPVVTTPAATVAPLAAENTSASFASILSTLQVNASV